VEGMPLLVFLHGDGNRALPESLENNPISCGCDEPLNYEAMAGVPVWGFCGDAGQDGSHYLPAMEKIAANINAAGGSANIQVLSGCDHAAAERAAWTKEVFEWLLSQ